MARFPVADCRELFRIWAAAHVAVGLKAPSVTTLLMAVNLDVVQRGTVVHIAKYHMTLQ